MGDQIHAVKHRLGWGNTVKDKKPEKIMNTIIPILQDNDILFGFGNFGGLGKQCVDYWQTRGEKYAL